MPFTFLRARRRRSVLAEPMAESDRLLLAERVGMYPRLPPASRRMLEDLARVIRLEKSWEGCAGLVLTGDMQLTIAAQAAVLLLGFGLDPLRDRVFPGLRTILVYPAGYLATLPRVGPGGVVSEGFSNLGEAHLRGPVVISWRDARRDAAAADDGRNLVLHEFAHQLDMLDGIVDGTPPLPGRAQYQEWRDVMTASFERLRAAAERGQPSLLSPYGATNPAEFFAVATEVFFERPKALKAHDDALYSALSGYYRQDPSTWTGE